MLPHSFLSISITGILILTSSHSVNANEPHANCGNYAQGSIVERTRYQQPEVSSPASCQSETQTNTCSEGNWTGWTGSHQFVSCKVNEPNAALPLLTAANLNYLGGFRLPSGRYGENNRSTLSYSNGVMAYNPANHSLFVVGHPHEEQIAEFSVPNIVNSTDLSALEVSNFALQNFTKLQDSPVFDTGIETKFKINGLVLFNNKLYVNYMGNALNQEHPPTTAVYNDAGQLAYSEISGPLSLDQGYPSSGWLSEIPEYWQAKLNATHIAGSPRNTGSGKKNQGPSAFLFNLGQELPSESSEVSTTKVLFSSFDTPLAENHLVHEASSTLEWIYNKDKLNELWTVTSNAVYGAIIPGTSTYLTVGYSSGHYSAIGDGITQSDGTQCTGQCAYHANDEYGYIWLWDVNHFLGVIKGEMAAEQLRPYYYGKLTTPLGHNITGATFDPESLTLYVSLAGADTTPTYSRPPLVLAYQISANQPLYTQDCGELASGETVSREMFKTTSVAFGQICESELQYSSCQNGQRSSWSGTYTASSCQVAEFNPDLAPLISIDQFEYQGGFRISGQNLGYEGARPTASYSNGIIAYNPKNHSIYLVGHPHEEQIAEFAIPNLVTSDQVSDFNVSATPIQNFSKFHNTDRVDTGIEANFKITGLELLNDSLIVNYVNYYDGLGKETDTTVVFKHANDLATSEISGAFQLNGAAHSAGWLSAIPQEWQTHLQGTHISGSHSGTSVNFRLSIGPSAYVISPEQDLLPYSNGAVDSQALLDFPLGDILFDTSVFSSNDDEQSILFNEQLNNDLWTYLSGASYGFILPGTSTYVTIGKSGGLNSGVGYKITQLDGKTCGGYCAYDPTDNYSFYWLWDVKDLLKVKNGELLPHNVRPYDYGKFPVPVDIDAYNDVGTIGGGAYDAETGMLYVSFTSADQIESYRRPPVVLAYKFIAK